MRLTEILKKFSKLISIVLKQEFFATIQNEKMKLEYFSSFFFFVKQDPISARNDTPFWHF